MPDALQPIAGFFALFALALAIAAALVTFWTYHRLRHPPRRTYATALAQGRPAQPDQLPPHNDQPRTFDTWSIQCRGHSLPVWDFKGDGPPTAPLFILTHGWGDSRIGALTRAQPLLPLASRFIAWDLPAHGDAPGACSLGVHEHEALRTLIEHAASSPPSTPLLPPIILLGWSLGAGISIAAMSNWNSPAARHVRAVIAEAPYRLPQTPARNMLEAFGLPRAVNLPAALALARTAMRAPAAWLEEDGPFDRAALARNLTCPLLILHGDLDAISPIEDARAIAAAAPRADLLNFPAAGHYSLWTDEETRDQILTRLRTLLT